MKQLQEAIQELEHGVLIEVSLQNFSELRLLMNDDELILNKLHDLVHTVFIHELKSQPIFIRNPFRQNKLYVLIGKTLLNDTKPAIDRLYTTLHLQIDDKHPEIYFDCSVSGIDFDQSNHNLGLTLSKLEYAIEHKDYSKYRRERKNQDLTPIDCDKIKRSNTQLNLLKSALHNKKAKFAYQPIVSSKTFSAQYYECLLRIPADGKSSSEYISAGPMIEEAENKGLIYLIDEYVLAMALEKLTLDPELKLAVNLSNIGVSNPKLTQIIRQAETSLRGSTSRLIIEITETAWGGNIEATRKFIEEVHKHNCLVALDDFGAGCTSLQQLINLPIDIVKVDGQYIQNILKNQTHQNFVQLLIDFCAKQNITTVAEYVESQETADLLKKMGVNNMQGNFFSEPKLH